MADYLIKGVTQDGNFRAYAILSSNLVAKAQTLHDTWASSSAALGRSLTGGLLMASSILKGDDKLSIKFDGKGPAGNIVVEATPKGIVKGYIQNPHVNLAPKENGHIDVAKAVGQDGFLTITKDQGFGMPFTGQVPIVSGEIGEDFTYYLAKSEQIPSAVGVSVFVNADSSIAVAGGFLIQLLPGADDEAISQLETKLSNMPVLSELLLEGKNPEDILAMLFDNTEFNVLEKMPVKFECDCSKDKFSTRMAALPKADLEELIEKDNGAEVVCSYCEKRYQFTKEDLENIIANQ